MNEALPLVVANLKANKSWQEVSTWIDTVSPVCNTFTGTIIFCPSHPFLTSSAQKIKSTNSKIKLGAQDVSCFEQGAYTGEVAASQIADLVSFAIVGHSERRQNFNEEWPILQKKVANAQAVGIEPIFCVQNDETPIAQNVKVIAYEPTFAIGTGQTDSIENITKVAQNLKQKGDYIVLYGGSVSKENAKSIANDPVDGILVGATNSLDPQKFMEIVNSLL